MKTKEYFWTIRKGREQLQFATEELFNSWPRTDFWKTGTIYAYLAPKLTNVDFITPWTSTGYAGVPPKSLNINGLQEF